MYLFVGVTVSIFLLMVGRSYFGLELLPYLQADWFRTALGAMFAALALLVVLLNIWLSWIDPWLYKRKYGDDEYRGVSPPPVIAGFFCAAAVVLLPASFVTGTVLLLLFLLDPAGLPSALYFLFRLQHRFK